VNFDFQLHFQPSAAFVGVRTELNEQCSD